MAERKWTLLWVMVFVAVAAIFAGGEGWAASATCLVDGNKDLPSGQCVNLSGYDVRIAKGVFPKYLPNGNSVFKWVIVPSSPSPKPLNVIDIKIPAAIQIGTLNQLRNSIIVSIIKPAPAITSFDFDKDDDDLDDHCGSPVSCTPLPPRTGTGTDPGWYLFDAGLGDPVTGLGKGEFDYLVLKVVPPSGCAINSRAKIRLVFKNRLLFAGLNTFFVKGSAAEGLNLLGPAQQSSQATSSKDQPAIVGGESCRLGETGCKMFMTYNSDGSLGKAVVVTAGVDPNTCAPNHNCCGYEPPIPLAIENISKYFDCKKDSPTGPPYDCKQMRSATASFCESIAGSCVYKTTVAGRTITTTIPEPCTPQ